MKTMHLSSVSATFNPFLPSSKIPRLVLSKLPASAYKTLKVTAKQLPRSSTVPATLELVFKDGKTLSYSWAHETAEQKAAARAALLASGNGEKQKKEKVMLSDIVWELDRHARGIAREEELKG
ncbi:hypothetical protein B0A52_01499 [Exophiala mesophila]|uniref:Large ribosomal subunit protein mL53 n=1 Tax=Exophiala mesophila TaxID=212818 RepID=A0A438NF72_EXOME|nr:hypothetical protein B0A52_01499 [Exophiala mesophila]